MDYFTDVLAMFLCLDRGNYISVYGGSQISSKYLENILWVWNNMHILEWPFIVASLSAIIMLSNQHLDMQHLWGGEVLTNTDLDRFVNNIWER